MKALSVRQPWAALIVAGLKTIETRTWPTKYREPVLICSGLKVDSIELDECPADMGLIEWPGGSMCNENDPRCQECIDGWVDDTLTGHALAVVDLVDCRPMTPEDANLARVPYREGLWAWVVDNVRPLKPFPVKGRLGIWGYKGTCETCATIVTNKRLGCLYLENESKCREFWEPADSFFNVKGKGGGCV